MKNKLMLIVMVIALAVACGKKGKSDKADTAATAARDTVASSPAGASYRAFGTEPFWSVTINAEGLHFVSPDDTIGVHFPPIEPIATGDTLHWTGKSDRGAIDVRIWPGTCSDDMSDKAWPYSSSAQLNEMSYVGCAEKR